MKLIRIFLCFIGDHKWTSAGMEGKQPTEAQMTGDLVKGFKDYTKMYCKYCKKISSLSL